MVISKRILLSFSCSQRDESQGAHARHLNLANEVLRGGLSQRGRYRAKKQKVKQPSDADLVNFFMNTSDSSQLLPGPDLAHHIRRKQNDGYTVFGTVILKHYCAASLPEEFLKKADFCSIASEILTW